MLSYEDNNAGTQPARDTALSSGKDTRKRSCESSPDRAKKCSRTEKKIANAQTGEEALLGCLKSEMLDSPNAQTGEEALLEGFTIEMLDDPSFEVGEDLLGGLASKIVDASNAKVGEEGLTGGLNNEMLDVPSAETGEQDMLGGLTSKMLNAPSAQRGEETLLGGFAGDMFDDFSFIMDNTVEEELKVGLYGDPEFKSQLSFEIESEFNEFVNSYLVTSDAKPD
jgi:hypothetical protein